MDINDAERLARDPAFRMLASRERRETSVALTSTLHWSETEVLADPWNYRGLSPLNTELLQHKATTRPLTQRMTLDIDSSGSPVHGAQKQAAYNGHFESALPLAIQTWSLTRLQQRLFRLAVGSSDRLGTSGSSWPRAS